MTFNNDTPFTNTPLTSTLLSNDSTDMSKEIKKLLDERCPSSEFREFVERFSLDGKYLFMRIKKIYSQYMYNLLRSIQIRSYVVRESLARKPKQRR
jgi:hypothetical protein